MRSARASSTGTGVLFAAVTVAASIACTTHAPLRAPEHGAAREVKSNVLRADYAGSAACAQCHKAITEKWLASPMHNMTRTIGPGVSRAPFEGVALRFKDDRVDLEERGGERFVHVHSTRFGDGDYRVTRVIGGHHREDYAGVAVGKDSGGDELVLPISYLLWSKKFRYKGYSVMSRERPGVAAGPVWNRTCIFCHNTEPYFSAMLGGLASTMPNAGHRHAAYQGELVDPLLPAPLQWSVAIDDASVLADELADDVAHYTGSRPSGSTRDLTWRAIDATRDKFTAKDLVEVGIGCESCHGGSKEHAHDPSVRTSFAPHAPGFHFTGETGDAEAVRAQRIDRTCARCHQVLFSRYPFTWEGGRRDQNPGGSQINSGEGRDFLLGACAKRASCTLCHDPHAPDNSERSARLETREGDVVCTQCHGALATEAAQRAHTHHDPSGAGGRCVACHMPKKNMSLEGGLGRYHRIASPNDPVKMLDRPLECALCHRDATVSKIAGDMERLWGKRIDRAVLTGVYGDLDRNVLDVTLEKGKPHEQAVAIALLGDAKEKRATRAIAEQLLNGYPLVRFYAEHALEQISGEPSPMDLYANDEDIHIAATAWASRIAP